MIVTAVIEQKTLLLLGLLGGDRNRRPVGQENQQSGGSAEGLAGDAVLAGPAAVLVLCLAGRFRDVLVPLLPVRATLDQQGFADVHEAEELLAAIIAEAGDEAAVLGLPGDGGDGLGIDLLDL